MNYHWNQSNYVPPRSLKNDDIPGTKTRLVSASKRFDHYQNKLKDGYIGFPSGRLEYSHFDQHPTNMVHIGNQGFYEQIPQKKHFNEHYKSEVTDNELLKESKDRDQQIEIFDFPRNLWTKDIPGTMAGTFKSKAVKNQELAHRIRTENSTLERQQRPLEEYLKNAHLDGSYIDRSYKGQTYVKPGENRSYSQGRTRNQMTRAHLLEGFYKNNEYLQKDEMKLNQSSIILQNYTNEAKAKNGLPELFSQHPYSGRLKDEKVSIRGYSFDTKPLKFIENNYPNSRLSQNVYANNYHYRPQNQHTSPIELNQFRENITNIHQQLLKPLQNDLNSIYTFNKNVERLDSFPEKPFTERPSHYDNILNKNESIKISNRVIDDAVGTKQNNNTEQNTNNDETVETFKSTPTKTIEDRQNTQESNILRYPNDSEEKSLDLKKVYVFNIISNRPIMKLIPSNSRLPSRYGYTVPQEQKEQKEQSSNFKNCKAQVIGHNEGQPNRRRYTSNPR